MVYRLYHPLLSSPTPTFHHSGKALSRSTRLPRDTEMLLSVYRPLLIQVTSIVYHWLLRSILEVIMAKDKQLGGWVSLCRGLSGIWTLIMMALVTVMLIHDRMPASDIAVIVVTFWVVPFSILYSLGRLTYWIYKGFGG